ncbi:MAG: hypothetical protein LBO74_12180 [Candidatus Symbiothrix sp.]|jgi:translation elongation factor EF-G|nr:hypothetical protein [Candidatus Symbiothrix sp.]
MDNYCLNREEIRTLIEHKLYNQDAPSNLKEIFDGASQNWDINVISCNSLLSIILEQYLKEDIVIEDLIERYYMLEEAMYITIEEFDDRFVEFLLEHKMPQKRNTKISELMEARKNKNKIMEKSLSEELRMTFEEDLVSTISDYHGKIYN